MLKEVANNEDYEKVSYDVEPLFTNIPVKETIEYVLHKIYVDKLNKAFCKKKKIQKIISKINKRVEFFSVNSCLIKQIDGCPMGGPVSDIFMCKMEEHVVDPAKPIFSKR